MRNVLGDPIQQIDARTNTTTTTYNLRRQPVTVSLPGGATFTNGYDNSRRLAFSTDFRGNMTRYSYSPTGKLLVTTNSDNSQIRNVYDARDWLVARIDELNRTNTFAYDAAGRLRQQRDGLRRLTTFEFDADGRQTNTITPLQFTSGQTYNLRGLAVSTRDFSTNYSTNVFDEIGLRTAFVNRRGYTNSFVYDDLNRQLAVINPLGRTNAQTWNNRGFVASLTQPSGRTTAMTYDDRGREQSRTDMVGTVARSYDGAGNVVEVTEGTNVIRRTFDSRNRISSYSDGRGHTLSYAYDDNGNLTALTYEPGKTVTYTYDNRNRMRTVTDWNGRTTTLSNDVAGQLVEITRPNGTRCVYTWDQAGQLVRVDDRHTPSREPVVALRMRYDANARLTNKLELPRWPAVADLPERVAAYNADNQLLTLNGASVSHDADGNIIVAPSPLGQPIQDYSWNARNQLVGIGTNTFFYYDAEGNRTRASENGTNISFVVDPSPPLSRVLARETETGRKVYYIYGPGLLYEIRQEPLSSTNDCRFYHFDHFGSTIALSDLKGKVIARASYTAYGELAQTLGTIDTPYLWQGEYGIESEASGVQFMRRRYYSPHLGRFLSQDPLGLAAGPNVYSYADGDPLLNNDPSGMILETAWDLANVGVGAYSLQTNIRGGHYGSAALDAIGIAYDVTATAVPFLPAGASAGLRAFRAGNSVIDSVEIASDVAKIADRTHEAARTVNTVGNAAVEGTRLHREVAESVGRTTLDNFAAGANRATGIQPDFSAPGIWVDITTAGQWDRHVARYSAQFGEGIPILYERGNGVVNTIRLRSGAGASLYSFDRLQGRAIK